MKKFPFVLLFAFLLICLISCQNPNYSSELDIIESYIQDYPDSALIALERLDLQGLNTEALRGKYSLLYAMALDKNYIDTTDIHLIQPAVDYYCKRRRNADYKLKTLFYQGVIFYNKGEFDSAIVSFSQAEEIASLSSDLLFVGLLYSRISDTYNRVHNAEEEYNYICLAEEVFSKSGTNRYYYSTLSRKGQALMNLQRYSEAEKVYISLLNDPSTPESIISNTKEDYALLLLSQSVRDPKSALSFFEEVLYKKGNLRNLNLWASYAFSLAACGHKKESEEVFAQLYSATDADSSMIDIWKSAAFEHEGRYHEAFSLLQSSLTYQDSLLNISLSQATARAQRDYLALKSNQIQLEDKKETLKLNQDLLYCTIESLQDKNENGGIIIENKIQNLLKKSKLINNKLSTLIEEKSTKGEKIDIIKKEIPGIQEKIIEQLNTLTAQTEKKNKEIYSKDNIIKKLKIDLEKLRNNAFFKKARTEIFVAPPNKASVEINLELIKTRSVFQKASKLHIEKKKKADEVWRGEKNLKEEMKRLKNNAIKQGKINKNKEINFLEDLGYNILAENYEKEEEEESEESDSSGDDNSEGRGGDKKKKEKEFKNLKEQFSKLEKKYDEFEKKINVHKKKYRDLIIKIKKLKDDEKK